MQEVVFDNGFFLSLTPQCPTPIKKYLEESIHRLGSSWFTKRLQNYRSRRNLAFLQVPGTEHEFVIKAKTQVPNDPAYPQLNLAFYTLSMFHEMRTSYALYSIVHANKHQFVQTVPYKGDAYYVDYHVQLPLAGISNTANHLERYSVFQYIKGDSPRLVIAQARGWNNVDVSLRKLFGSLQLCCSTVAESCVEHGLEPYDLGAHQVIYRIDETAKVLHLTIIDTEEYRFYDKESLDPTQKTWPDSVSTNGLPATLLIEAINNSAFGGYNE